MEKKIISIALFVFILLNACTNKIQEKSLECKSDEKQIQFIEPEKEIISAKIDNLGGTLQKRDINGNWIIVNFPKNAIKEERTFNLKFKESTYTVHDGEIAPLTFEISPDISFDIPIEIIIQYNKKYGCDITLVPYLIKEKNQLSATQLIKVNKKQHIFIMHTFHGGNYSWVYAK